MESTYFYPGTDTNIIAGDILYSHKIARSSLLVGHIAIIGEDFHIYHVNRWGKKGHRDSFPVYSSRHQRNEKITILRHEEKELSMNAVKWARLNIEKVKSYTYNWNLADIEKNYCSKFIWQAFYFGNEQAFDLLGKNVNLTSKRFITPTQIFHNLKRIDDFKIGSSA